MGIDRSQSISLIGMPGAGKSTIGVLLAKQLGRPFIDTDVHIQATVGRTLQEIIDADGLEVFRRLEEQAVGQIQLAGHIVATGGSVIYGERAMEHLSSAGPVVYLAMPLGALTDRLTDLAVRGLVKPADMTMEQLYAEREPLYKRWADITIDCLGLNQQEIVDAVIDTMRGYDQ